MNTVDKVGRAGMVLNLNGYQVLFKFNTEATVNNFTFVFGVKKQHILSFEKSSSVKLVADKIEEGDDFFVSLMIIASNFRNDRSRNYVEEICKHYDNSKYYNDSMHDLYVTIHNMMYGLYLSLSGMHDPPQTFVERYNKNKDSIEVILEKLPEYEREKTYKWFNRLESKVVKTKLNE